MDQRALPLLLRTVSDGIGPWEVDSIVSFIRLHCHFYFCFIRLHCFFLVSRPCEFRRSPHFGVVQPVTTGDVGINSLVQSTVQARTIFNAKAKQQQRRRQQQQQQQPLDDRAKKWNSIKCRGEETACNTEHSPNHESRVGCVAGKQKSHLRDEECKTPIRVTRFKAASNVHDRN